MIWKVTFNDNVTDGVHLISVCGPIEGRAELAERIDLLLNEEDDDARSLVEEAMQEMIE